MTVPVYIPINSLERFCFSIPSPARVLFVDFIDDDHSDQCEVILRCSFDLHFSNSDVENRNQKKKKTETTPPAVEVLSLNQ